ncbi:ABC transporter [Fictibacillus macauensis ZFHKF-1]|uniref:ABC transporter n=1 Tax=Fictibacillus macauensis ZFHKF-1 TaxID=1196324 RepID=I8AJW7_9BACL|nr:ATP-binding cassette domain-containing protein [Fictibacillus macauensis]EIT86087.1 ABC transporter [Fictibacillus macauensis ZFHKF-1]
MNTLSINQLTKSYAGKKVIDNLSLEVKGTFGLLGPNGAGKTTLMKIIATLIKPEQGTLHLNDLSWQQTDQVREILGYLPQHFSIYKSLRVDEVMNHFALLKGIKENRETIIQEILAAVNLLDDRKKKIKHLSGGMLRRLGIAQALLGDPKIIVVDEPTAGLDIDERVRFCRLLRKLGEGRIILLSTHIVEDIETTCDYIAIIKNGNVLATGTKKEIAEIVQGHVYEKKITMAEEMPIEEEHIISTKQIGDDYLLRYFSPEFLLGSTEAVTNLEDAYLCLTRGWLTQHVH